MKKLLTAIALIASLATQAQNIGFGYKDTSCHVITGSGMAHPMWITAETITKDYGLKKDTGEYQFTSTNLCDTSTLLSWYTFRSYVRDVENGVRVVEYTSGVDSGKIEIEGDTIAAVRLLIEQLETQTKLHDAARDILSLLILDVVGDLMENGGGVAKQGKERIKPYREAVREYRKLYKELLK